MADQKKVNEQFMRVGFNAGWAAAHISVAITAEEQGLMDLAAWLRERANKPDRVQIEQTEKPNG